MTDCSQVEAVMAPFIADLVADPYNEVGEWGASCTWESPDSETELTDVRSVAVTLTAIDSATEKPDPEMVVEYMQGTVLEDAWVAAQDGIAYSAFLGSDAIGVEVTTVWVPGVESVVSASSWGHGQKLDGPAAVAAVAELLG